MRLGSLTALALVSGLIAPALLAPDQAPTLTDLYSAGDEALWSFEKDGQRFGTSWSRYEGAVDLAGVRAHHFRAQVALGTETPSGKLEQRYSGELWADASGRPLRFTLLAGIADSVSGVDVLFGLGEAEATLMRGGKESTLHPEVPEGSYVLANNFLSHLELVLALQPPAAEGSRTYPMFAANTLKAFQLEVKHIGDFEDDPGAPGSVYRDSLGETLRMARSGKLLTVEIPAQELVLRRVEEPYEPFVLERPRPTEARADFDREDVHIEHGQVSLSGTITRRKGADGRLPAVFFVSGSGGQDRDGFGGGLDLGTHEILDRLTQEGFLVLRVDDRGVGESKGPTEGISYEDLVEDARRCVLYLRSRADVDPARIAVIGHSEGGQTAPILAAQVEGLAAIALMAAPGRPPLELLEEQLLRAKRLEGASEEELQAYGAAIEDFGRRLTRGEPIAAEGLPAELALFLPTRAWLASHARQDPIANIEKVRCPILLLQGARDIQVSLERDARPLEAALDASGHEDHELLVFDELDHLFKKTVGTESSGLDYFKSRPVDARFLDRLSAWLKARLQRG